MNYITCPTCGYFLGSKTIEYEEKKNIICKNPKFSKEEREEKIQEVVQNLKLRRYCCTMRIMSYKDMVYEIIPIPLKKEKNI
jgi:DNA-directed RNA polymerase subunit N (RpoN/RPB10)